LILLYTNPDHYSPTINAIELLRRYFAVHILCRNIEPPRYEWPKDVVVHRLGRYSSAQTRENANPLVKVIEYGRFIRATRRTMRILNPQIIYAFDSVALAVALLARTETSDPIVFHCHEQPDRKALRILSLEAWIIKYAIRRARSAALVVYPEEYRARYYMQWASDNRAPLIVPNCPELGLLNLSENLDTQIERRWQKREILYTGTIGPGYGLLESVDALSILDDAFTLKLFGIVRDPAFVSNLVEKARTLGLDSRIRMEGWLPRREFLVQTMDGSLGLALYEPIGINRECVGPASMKLFEYAARGIPLVVPPTKSFIEFFAQESWVAYADPGDPKSLARAIAEMFEDRERYRDVCHAARRAFQEKYNYEHVYAPVIERVLELTRAAANGAGARESASVK
jgi:glycosyltransferase involved in cell wall biosynthesis